MRGSTLVPPELPVLRPPAVDNSAARWVVKQPRPPIGTTNPGRVSLLRVGTLPLDGRTKRILCPQHTLGLLRSNTG